MQEHTIDISRVLQDRDVNKKALSQLLFPKIKFPEKAFDRIVSGVAELSASQVSLLAQFLGCEINDLYDHDKWLRNNSWDANRVFIYGRGFRAEYNTQTGEALIFSNNQLIDKETVPQISISGLKALAEAKMGEADDLM